MILSLTRNVGYLDNSNFTLFLTLEKSFIFQGESETKDKTVFQHFWTQQRGYFGFINRGLHAVWENFILRKSLF